MRRKRVGIIGRWQRLVIVSQDSGLWIVMSHEEVVVKCKHAIDAANELMPLGMRSWIPLESLKWLGSCTVRVTCRLESLEWLGTNVASTVLTLLQRSPARSAYHLTYFHLTSAVSGSWL